MDRNNLILFQRRVSLLPGVWVDPQLQNLPLERGGIGGKNRFSDRLITFQLTPETGECKGFDPPASSIELLI